MERESEANRTRKRQIKHDKRDGQKNKASEKDLGMGHEYRFFQKEKI